MVLYYVLYILVCMCVCNMVEVPARARVRYYISGHKIWVYRQDLFAFYFIYIYSYDCIYIYASPANRLETTLQPISHNASIATTLYIYIYIHIIHVYLCARSRCVRFISPTSGD